MSDQISAEKVPKCPICSSARDPVYRPFCSRRCADIDLGRWFTGGYVIPGGDSEESTEDGSATDVKNDLD